MLRVEGLSLTIGGDPILKDVSFAVNPGETLGIIGESGSGKSMTANAIMGLAPQASVVTGQIFLDATELLGLSEREMTRIRGARIGMVFQEPMTALNPVQTIGAQVAEGIALHHRCGRAEAWERAAKMLERSGLPNADFPLDRYPHELSGGQRQRVVIAMAIAAGPQVVIADEPTTALDVTTQQEILDLLKSLTDDEGVALILISHDLGVVADMADTLAIMRHGEIVEAGPADQVFAQMRHPYTRALLEASTHQPDRAHEPHDVPLLDVRGLSRDYLLPRASLFSPREAFRAVRDVSFSIRRGESLGLVGGSGCGKSTLTRAILGLEPIAAGEVLMDGQPALVDGVMARETRARMQVVFQDPFGSFNPRHRVSRLVTEPFHLLDTPPTGAARDAAIAEALTSVGIEPEAQHRFIHEFSGGQRQRIAIARALIIKPDLIILDEAVSALDVSIRAQILDLLADLSDRFGLSYLFISHDLSVVRAITDRVLVMQAGEIVEEGQTEAIFADPKHPYTQSLIDAVPKLPNVA